MSRQTRILLLVGGLVCTAGAATLWLLPASECTTCAVTSIGASAISPPPMPPKRISEGGFHYGYCAGTSLAVYLSPEPCGWDEVRPGQTLAIR